jgi:competence protein ComEC
VLHLRTRDLDVLLTADAEAELTPGLDFPPVDVLKVAHHGSEDAGLPAALEQLRPQVAAIMVGRDNTYGHPTRQTLDELRSVPHVYRTDRDGTVRVRALGGRLDVALEGAS